MAVVSDSYDIWNCCSDIWGKQLKSLVENRNGCLVVRPDSGDPATVVLKVLGILGDAFGYSVNKQGFKILPSFIRIIQGDGIHIGSLNDILDKIVDAGWSADNVGYGSGGALLQRHTRDTCKFAMKCSFALVDGKYFTYSMNIGLLGHLLTMRACVYRARSKSVQRSNYRPWKKV